MKSLTDTACQRASELGKKLMAALTARATRKLFFSTLSRLLQEQFHFDRLCINLYDQQGEMLTYFTAAEGTIVSTLSPVRPAEAASTVAGHVIATRKPVIITDFAQHFSESSVHPIAEAGLTATMAFPLVLDNEIIATLHCSFARKPEDIYGITSFLLELSPIVATCLGAILSLERTRNEASLAMQPLLPLDPDDIIICHSRRMREIMRRVDMMAKLNIPVLLLGETGTGKTLIAQHIHRRSTRKDGNFVKVNCPSLPGTLFESELFGHAKGAFTGAANKRIGRFELAHGGTLFLDEIGELSPEMQSKLLQVLEDSSFERVGESVSLAVDVRIVAATNVNLGQALSQGRLRADLFYRLSPCTIELPPLRERPEDIAPLFAALSSQAAARLGLPPAKFPSALVAPLLEYDWPGNVRELRNLVSRLLIHGSEGRPLTPALVEDVLRESRALAGANRAPSDAAINRPASGGTPGASFSPRSEDAPEARGSGTAAFAPVERAARRRTVAEEEDFLPATLAEMERRHIVRTLERTGGVIAGPGGAAALLGIPRSTLQHRMRKLGIG